MIKTRFSIVLILFMFSFLFQSCSPETTEIVCDYGTVLCDVSTTMCNQIPGIPEPVCDYLNLACYNLDQLCQLRDSTDSPKYQAALFNLQSLTDKLRSWNDNQASKKKQKE